MTRLLLVFGILLITGCSAPSRIDGEAYVKVLDTDKPKTLVMMLGQFYDCEGSKACLQDETKRKELQEDFESCIASGLKKTAPNITLKKDWLADKKFEVIRKSLAEQKQETKLISHVELNKLGVDYLASLHVKTSQSDSQVQVEVGEATPGAINEFIIIPPVLPWAVGESWTNSAWLETRIYDSVSGKVNADISAKLTEEGFWMLPVITIIPLIPFGYSPDVADSSCVDLGEAMGRFFSGAANDHVETSLQ